MNKNLIYQSQPLISRRQFMGTIGGVSAALFNYSVSGIETNKQKNFCLIEGAHFSKKGGWSLDTQFHNTLGFSYLLAHGMGKPVPNASTTVQLPASGDYYLWAHTKNWCPGNWEAPGRFRIILNGKPSETLFGTRPGWGWQNGGKIHINDRTVSISLEDLTGFEGRCSAIYLTQSAEDIPPDNKKQLEHWRRDRAALGNTPGKSHHYDLVIAGGGIAGCAAALAAEEKGLQVALIQNRPVLGGNASSEIRVHTLGVHGNASHILRQIDTPHYKNGDPAAYMAEFDRHYMMNESKGIHQFLNHTMISVAADDGVIRSVDAIDHLTGKITRFSAPVFIDCTGDGWLGYMAGAKYRYGRESKNEFAEGWDEHGDLWSPETPDNRVMGTTIMWRTRLTDSSQAFAAVPWASPIAKDLTSTGGNWYWEFSHNDLHQIHDAEEIRDHMFRAIYGTFYNTKQLPEHKNRELEWIAFVAGKRESRRLMGDYVYTLKDADESIGFEDAVVTEKREIDIHFQQKLTGHPNDFLSKAIFREPKGSEYYIPFRSLYSRNINNLMMAGRCFSCSHVGLGGPRVMNTCGQMGVATGYAAVLCKQTQSSPREIYQNHLRELRELCGYA